MVLTESDIRQMVESVVKETRHVVDDALSKLGDMIYNTAINGGGEICPEAINSCNPYFKTDRPLKISVMNLPGSANARIDHKTGEIDIDPMTLKGVSAKEIIMHELSHYIDLTKRMGTYTDDVGFPSAQFIDCCIYWFKPTEIQARLVEYAYRLKRSPRFARYNLSHPVPNSSLRMKEMQEYINRIKSAKFDNTKLNADMALVIGIFYQEAAKRAQRRHGTDVQGVKPYLKQLIDWQNMTPEDFETKRKLLLKIYEKRLRSMKNKALKIRYDALMSNQ